MKHSLSLFGCAFAAVVFSIVGCGGDEPVDRCLNVTCDDESECTEDACNPADGSCDFMPVADGGECNFDGLPGLCASGVCEDAMFCEGVDCDDESACTDDTCDPADGSCVNTSVPDDTECNYYDLPGFCLRGGCEPVSWTWTVCPSECDFTSIQPAIDISVDGENVLVFAGTYQENIDFDGKLLVVTSADGPEVTIIDGNQEGSVVTFRSVETRDSVLRGFTITNGSSSVGGGIMVRDSSPSIFGNIVTNNSACPGGGIGIEFSSPLVQHNEITHNTCSVGWGGGGVSIGGASAAEIIENLIADNESTDGGGIAMWAAGDPTIYGNEIRGNHATGGGGGLSLVNRSEALIVQNLIYGNSAEQGGGISWLVPSGNRGPRLINNTIADNDATVGSGIFADGYDGQTPLINNIIVGKRGQSAIYCGDFNDLEAPIFSHNDVFAVDAPAYAGHCPDQTGLNGNISADPRFVDPEQHNYDLTAGSPAVDSGDTTIVDLPAEDFAGRPRTVDGNEDDVADVDIGAFEFQGPAR